MTFKTRRLSTCHRHPTEPLTGFCASCLRERLAGIESSTTAAGDCPAVETRPALKLRRTKSFSCSAAEPPSSSSTVPEPCRRSCEVHAAQGTLCDLLKFDGTEENGQRWKPVIDSRKLDFQIREEEEEEEHRNNGGEGVRVCGDDFACFEETKTMKEFIDLEFQSRKNSGRDFREIAGSFYKRLRKWRRKHKVPKNSSERGDRDNGNGNDSVGGRRIKETQSEVGEYGLFGRRSCDTDPRLSIDVARMSLDGYGYDPRFSFEVSRASWDGYLIGKACPRFSPMIRVNGVVDDNRVLVEEEEEEGMNLASVGEHCPGGSVQTKDYYSDSHGKKSFDRSNSRRKPSMADVDELRVISNAKVSPATTELFYGAKVLITENDLGNGNLNNVQYDSVTGSASTDVSDVVTQVDQRGSKKLHKWERLWNKLGLVQRRKEDKLGEEKHGAGGTGNRPISESWQKLRRVVNRQASGSVSRKLIQSYSVSHWPRTS
ncbi:hypothetical protein TanjilG_20178 [Lupinus angustifolius]|uniref:Uncharacterized protein n=1 Tax=Lupinus angustifolius TaxID=3871 RepID=A0A1J7FVB9_LUPAN|nr:hypothetical protein TanjilG_20178 [Lupinus angustifolius]